MLLEVRKTKKKHTIHTDEAAWERKFMKQVTRAGILSYHTTDSVVCGIPDRYITGGRWIEFKIILYAGSRGLDPTTHFSPAQKIWLDKLTAAGDQCWANILFQKSDGEERFMHIKWEYLRDMGKLTPEQISTFTFPLSRIDDIIESLLCS